MKRIIVIGLLLVLALPMWSSAAAVGPARVRHVEGEALFRAPDSDEWLAATVNTPLDEGDTVWCPDDSRVEMQLPDGSILRLDGGTQLDLLANEDDFIHLHLASGRMYLRTTQATKSESIQVDADDTTVLPDARTRLHIDMLPNGHEDVAIIKGSAYVEGNGSRTRVRAGEHIVLEDGYNEILPLNPAGSWELWNTERDRELSRSTKAGSYLPEELRGYSAELDSNGSWVNVPEYGVVWRPTVIISSDWAPYREGRWIWKGDDYVWLSFETWGWVPYHYGRWAVVSGFGWCWVPPSRGDVYWSPGYVGWYRTGSHVGWTPLAPGETFYGRRHYGRHSVIITNGSINAGTVTYRNRTNPGGLTVLPHDDFLHGRPASHRPARAPSVSVSVSLGSPRIQPLRETRMPIIKQTPPRIAPPRVEHRDRRELRTRFPRIAPKGTAERRQQQPAAPVPAPSQPAGRTIRIEDKKGTLPSAIPTERPLQPDRQKPQSSAPPREERRERSQQQQTTIPTAPPVLQSQPQAGSETPSQHNGQQRRGTGAQGEAQPRQQPSVPKSDVRPPASTSARPQAETSGRTERQRQEQPHREVQPRKVWRVTAPEVTPEREPARERDLRGRDRR